MTRHDPFVSVFRPALHTKSKYKTETANIMQGLQGRTANRQIAIKRFIWPVVVVYNVQCTICTLCTVYIDVCFVYMVRHTVVKC